MSDDYKRGYGKGYYAGCRRSDPELAAARESAHLAAIRAERAESAAGVGHCQECRHWRRGGESPNPERCAWGICTAPRGAGTPWGCWASGNDDAGGKLQTTPHFGCVLFVPIVPDGGGSTP